MKFPEVQLLQDLLDLSSDKKTKIWWENYLKHVTPFRGVKMALIRKSLHKWFKNELINEKYSEIQQIEIAVELIQQKFSEDKLAGILFLQEILLPSGAIKWNRDLPKFAELFDMGYINDWNICDWFCVKVLGFIIKKHGKEPALMISSWKTSKTIWQRRASVVAFVNLAKQGEKNFNGFVDIILENSMIIIDKERFIQTGTGWTLRELSLADKNKVIEFIKENLNHLTKEGLQYAIKYLLEKEKKRLLDLHKLKI